MDRYYKTNRNSWTGLKLKTILDRAEKFNKQVNKLGKKYGFTDVYHSTFYYKSLDAVVFKEEPDKTIWKKVRDVHKGYYPRVKCRNKEVLADFNELRKINIRRDELDEIIGNNNVFCHAGFDFSVPNIYIFIVNSEWECNIPEDCKEISNIEYDKLTAKSITNEQH